MKFSNENVLNKRGYPGGDVHCLLFVLVFLHTALIALPSERFVCRELAFNHRACCVIVLVCATFLTRILDFPYRCHCHHGLTNIHDNFSIAVVFLNEMLYIFSV